ncbi:Rhodanese-like domain-containing protein [Nemania sp. FL0916]|nr:Rhodanese-like domain-containing protein [Nemania sp. FL0916]
MATIPARRILSTGTLAPRTCLRGTSSSAAKVCAVTSPLRAQFSSSGSFATKRAVSQQSKPVQARLGLRTKLHNVGGARWSTTSATGSKIWTFEEIQTLSSDPSKSKPTLIDVREPSELSSTGRIPGAVNVPITTWPDSFHISASEFRERFGFRRPPQEEEIVFYCKAGVRSRGAAAIAREAGWKDVGEYPGSWIEWAGKGGDVQK